MGRNLCRSVLSFFSILLCFMVVPVSFGSPLDLLPFENLTADIGRGFGDTMNRYSWSMDNFNGNVYVGTWNVVLDYPAILNAIKNGEIGGGGNPLEGIQYTHSHGGEIWKHNGDQNWERVFKAGEDDNGFRIMAQYNGDLYTGSQNNTGANIYRTTNGTNWTELTGGPVDNANNISIRTMIQHNGFLYVGTENNKTGGELWQYNGSGWNKLQTFSDPSVAELHVFNNKLYLGTWNFNDKFKFYESAGGGFTQVTPVFPGSNNLQNLGVMKLIDYKGYFYLGTVNYQDGFTLLRTKTPGNPNSWQVLTTNGFGNPDNSYSWSMKIHNGVLYLGTFNSGIYGGQYAPAPIPLDGRAQLWYTEDGATWKMMNDDGFGTPFTYGYRTMAVNDNRLFVGTASHFMLPDPSDLNQLLAIFMQEYGSLNIEAFQAFLGQMGVLGGGYDIGTQVWASQSVPEPGTMLLLVSGLIGLVGLKRKIKS